MLNLRQVIKNLQITKNKILFIICLVSFNIFNGYCEPFNPSIYLGLGYKYNESQELANGHLDLYNNNIISNNGLANNRLTQKNSGYNIIIGIKPNIPIINNFRVQLQYDINKSNYFIFGNTIIASIYYDFYLNSLPILTPYFGVSSLYFINVTVNTNSVSLSQNNIAKTKVFLPAFNFGLELNIPTTSLSFFAEYKYITSNVFKNLFKIVFPLDNDLRYVLEGYYTNKIIIFGIKYYV